jgi:hypothetical protein
MTQKVGARVLLALGFLAASISYSSWIVSRTALDPQATRSATHAILSAPAVRSALARQIHDTLAPELDRATASDPKLRAAINAAVADPRFVNAFDDAIVRVHKAILSDKGGKVTLDTHAVTVALRQAVARHDPAAAKKMKAVRSVSVPIGSAQVPHIGGATRTVGRVGTTAALVAVLLVGSALLLAHDARMIGRAGRRVAWLAVGPLIAFALLPRLLSAAHGSTESVAAALLRAYGHRVIPSAIAFAVIGLSIWLTALVVPVLYRRRRPAEPATAPDLPPTFARSSRERFTTEERATALPEKLYL